jgi:hypothetical protein
MARFDPGAVDEPDRRARKESCRIP